MIETLFAGFVLLFSYSQIFDRWYWKDYKTVDELAQYCNTPKKLAIWTKDNIKSEHQHEWYSAETVLKEKKGDCKGFATIYFEVLKKQKYDPHLICVYTEHEGHAICCFKKDEQWYILDNIKGLIKVDAKNLNDIPNYVYNSNLEYWYERNNFDK